MKLRGNFLALASLAVLGLGLQSASAASLSFLGSGIAPGDNLAISAQADFNQTSAGGNVTITLTNLTLASNTQSAKELLVGLVIIPTPAGFPTGFSKVSETFAQSLTLNGASPDIGTLGAGGTPQWDVDTNFGNGINFEGHSHGPAIIGGPVQGSGTVAYNLANSSVDNETPEIYRTMTFVLGVPTGFNISSITGVGFRFNTDGAISIPGDPKTGAVNPVPLPAAVWSGGALIVALAAFRRIKRKSVS